MAAMSKSPTAKKATFALLVTSGFFIGGFFWSTSVTVGSTGLRVSSLVWLLSVVGVGGSMSELLRSLGKMRNVLPFTTAKAMSALLVFMVLFIVGYILAQTASDYSTTQSISGFLVLFGGIGTGGSLMELIRALGRRKLPPPPTNLH